MFVSFDESKFIQALENKDYDRLISDFACAVRSDPAFQKKEIPAIIRIFEERVPEIFSNKVDLDYEEELPQSDWNEDYFFRLLQRLQNNFCKERLEYLKKVGRIVYKDLIRDHTQTTGKPHKTGSAGPTVRTGPSHTSNRPQANKENFPTAGILVTGILAVIGVVLVVMVVIHLIK